MDDHVHQEISFDAAPAKIYEVLTNSSTFRKMSGDLAAEIDATAGGAFSCYDGLIVGINVECIPGERLVQTWRGKFWDPGVFSIVRIDVTPDGSGTRLVFDQAGVPLDHADHILNDWERNYWEPIRAMLAD